jgi:hypothetical protein
MRLCRRSRDSLSPMKRHSWQRPWAWTLARTRGRAGTNAILRAYVAGPGLTRGLLGVDGRLRGHDETGFWGKSKYRRVGINPDSRRPFGRAREGAAKAGGSSSLGLTRTLPLVTRHSGRASDGALGGSAAAHGLREQRPEQRIRYRSRRSRQALMPHITGALWTSIGPMRDHSRPEVIASVRAGFGRAGWRDAPPGLFRATDPIPQEPVRTVPEATPS